MPLSVGCARDRRRGGARRSRGRSCRTASRANSRRARCLGAADDVLRRVTRERRVLGLDRDRLDRDQRRRATAAARPGPGTASPRRARRCSGAKTSCSRPLPKSGRLTRSPGAVNSTCSIRSRTWSSSPVVGGAAARRRSGRGSRRASRSLPDHARSAPHGDQRRAGRARRRPGCPCSTHRLRRRRATRVARGDPLRR